MPAVLTGGFMGLTVALFTIIILPRVATDFDLIAGSLILTALVGVYSLGYWLWRSLTRHRNDYYRKKRLRVEMDLEVGDVMGSKDSYNYTRILLIVLSGVMSLLTAYYITGVNILIFFAFVFVGIFFAWQGLGLLRWRLIE